MREWEQLGPYRLRLKEGVFPVTGDALALGEFATVKDGWRVCDLGCGSGVLLLMAARRGRGLTLVGVDVDRDAAALTEENLRRNGLEGTALQGDAARADTLPKGEPFDLVLCNPPYFPAGAGESGGRARMEETGDLKAFVSAGRRLLKHGGRLAVCYRVERLTDLFCTLRGERLEPQRLKLAPPLALVEAVKNARSGGLKAEESGA